MVDTSFWHGRRVLVTGHTGFKGAWLSLWLQRLGANVVGYSLEPPTSPSLFETADVAQGMISESGDVRDLEHLTDVIAAHRPEVLFHLAAQSLVRRSYAEPVDTFAVNVLGTVNLLEAVRRTDGVLAVVVVTTDKCYESREWEWGYRENDTLGGYDPYSSSKACAELAVSSYRRSFLEAGRVPVASARAGNVIGGGDWAEHRLVPDIIRSIESGAPIVLRNPTAIRPWQHVLEPLGAYLHLAQSLAQGGDAFASAWNFGPEPHDARPVLWIAEHVAALWGLPSYPVHVCPGGAREARSLKLDCSKAREHLQWRPRWDLKTALAATVGWYKACCAGEDLRRFTLRQIEEYTAGLGSTQHD